MTTGVHPSDGKETSWDGADAQVYRGERTRATDNGPIACRRGSSSRHFCKPLLLRQWEKEGLARLPGWGKTIEVAGASLVVVQITDVSQTKWIEEGWFRFDSKREWELYGSSLKKREYLLFFYYRLDFLC